MYDTQKNWDYQAVADQVTSKCYTFLKPYR